MRKAAREEVVSIIFAAGKGSRMLGYPGNKTLLPLLPGASLNEGKHPLLLEVLKNLPLGPKGIVVHHCAPDVQAATESLGVSYLFQPVTNGTGGALLVARPFLESLQQDSVIITMGDVPLIRPATYLQLVQKLEAHPLVLLAFSPHDKAQYGMIEMEDDRPLRIVEWKYWSAFPVQKQKKLTLCNAGVYAARRTALLPYLDLLEKHPHTVRKQRGADWVPVEEYFITDLVELMSWDGLSIGAVLAPEEEVAGVDTPESLEKAQKHYAREIGA